MSIARNIGILLIAGGGIGLLYGASTYMNQTHSAKLGPVVVAVHEQTDYVPLILSAAAIVLGAALLLTLRDR
jgi:hypothetical protein